MATINSINSTIPISLAKGGTNATSMTTDYATIYYDTSKLATVASAGSAGQLLTSNGGGSPPTFQDSTASTPGFYAHLSADTAYNLTGDGTPATVPLNAERFDTGSDFNTGTYTFTVPSTGYYVMTGTVMYAVTATSTDTAANAAFYESINHDNPNDALVFGTGRPEPMDSSTPYTSGNAGDGLWGANLFKFNNYDASDAIVIKGAYLNSSLGKATGFEAATNGCRSIFSGYLAGN